MRALLALAIAASGTVGAQTTPPRFPASFAALDSAARAYLAATRTPGLALAVVVGDSLVFARGYGVRSLDAADAVTPETLFQLGSLTKPFTALTAASLATDGRLDLDAPVGRYVRGLDPALARVTTAQLLSHSAGLRHETAEYGSHDEGAYAAYARSWGAGYAMLPPGLGFSYSNPGYTLAGLAAEEAGGQPYATLVQARLLDPLGMHRSTFRPTVAMTWPLAVGHRGRPGTDATVVRPLADDTRHWPAGYLWTSARELARFATALLNDGRLEGRQAIPAQAIRLAMAPRVEIPHELEPAYYGLGFFLGTYRGIPTVWHAGDMPGYSATLRMLPRQRVAVIALANRQGLRPDPLLDAVLTTLGIRPDSAPTRSQPVLAISEREMQAVAGRYTNSFAIEVLAQNGRLVMRRPGGDAPLWRIGAHRFTTDSTRRLRAAELDIVPPEGGRPGYVSMWIWRFARDTRPPD